MEWVDKLSRKIGVSQAKKILAKEECLPDIKKELSELDGLRETLIKTEEELAKTKLEWDRTFDSIVDNIVLIDRDRCISKANNSFYCCVEKEIGHVEFIGMNWKDFKVIADVAYEPCLVDECFNTGFHKEGLVTMGKKIYHVTANPIHTITDSSKEIVGVVRISRDVTKYRKTREQLERRSNIYNAISQMSKTLVNHEDWSGAVNLILGDLGRAIGASRVYIFKNEIREDRICSVKQNVFHNSNIRNCEAGTITDCLNYHLMPDWQSKMQHGLSVEGNLVECNLCPQKHQCICADDVLVCAVPIFVDKKWWGFIGFDYMNGTRVWKDEDETLLRIAADILGGVIFHRGRYWDVLNGLEECEDQLNGDCEIT
jgi:hypothetical protein